MGTSWVPSLEMSHAVATRETVRSGTRGENSLGSICLDPSMWEMLDSDTAGMNTWGPSTVANPETLNKRPLPGLAVTKSLVVKNTGS